MENKTHWYDGIFYDKVIAPNQDKSYGYVKTLIDFNSSLLDAGCGTGRLGFKLHDKCSKITGIDLSIKNIRTAKNNLSRINTDKLEFIHSGINEFFNGTDNYYDYAVISYVIHEVPEHERAEILNTLSKYAGKIIIIDYMVPRPGNFWSALNEVVEFAAGRDHYRNFKNYVKNNGINGLAESTGLKIVKEIKNNPSSSHIAVLTRNVDNEI